MPLKSICGIVLISENPERLAQFYAAVLGIEFQGETHGNLDTHYGTDIGEVHFGIHPPSNFGGHGTRGVSPVVAFNVDSLDDCLARLAELNAEQVSAPHDEGFGRVSCHRDPDGGLFELVELNYDFGDG
jgi:predicted enzyme related to lactoylglutathione lyase